jgi:predicted transcriptional regulator
MRDLIHLIEKFTTVITQCLFIYIQRFSSLVKYRSRTDIAALILEAADGGAAKTKIMYRAFLSYAQLKEYLAVLLENGLIEYSKADQFYRITQKGMRFVQLYNQVGELISPGERIIEK